MPNTTLAQGDSTAWRSGCGEVNARVQLITLLVVNDWVRASAAWLSPGDTTTRHRRERAVHARSDDFALLDENLERVVEPGTFTVFVGGSSDTTNQATFEVTSGARLQGPGSAIPRELR